MAIKVRATCWF